MDEDSAAVKESRRVMRLVHEHLSQAHLDLGAQQDHIGLVDVIHHPTSKAGYLNYITPRRNTAWIPAPEVENGLNRLRELERRPRVVYIEGLFLPVFSKTLTDLGLSIEQQTTIMAFNLSETTRLGAAKPMPLPDDLTISAADDQQGLALWWYVWRNAHYDVVTRGIEPIYIGQDMRAVALGHQIDLLMYRHDFPVGVARLTLRGESAHITTLALMKEHRTEAMTHTLYHAALKAAAEHHCTVAFTSGDTEADRRLCREIGFIDSGSIVCYAENQPRKEAADDALAQSVFVV